ncbi:dihydrodipicolinate reductase [Dietzia psychralcaliphila]|uniref:dihydrodipicolinate reductase n=1 Tax=Dietzia psychralcaliphila TaxID=139021 RepID=UPI001C1E56C2|nr:dihydrodipicolinate reductase [Dietzia psychralcaliphila]
MKVVVCHTGGVGSQVVRLLLAHPQHELVGVLAHDESKVGRDVGELVGVAECGIRATDDVDELIALAPDCALWHGVVWHREVVARFLRAGINVYTGMGGFDTPLGEDSGLLEACAEGRASLASGGNIPGLISDVLPLFLSGYSGNVRRIRATQRSHVADYPSAFQLSEYLNMGATLEEAERANAADAVWVTGMAQSARLVAEGLGVSYGHTVISAKEFAPATEDLVLPGSGLEVAEGAVAGVRRTFTTTSAEGAPFLDVVNEQTVALGLGAHWRQEVDQPNWTVEIDGDPSIRCELAVGHGSDPGQDPVTALNAARAVNFIREVVAAPPGFVSVLDVPAPRGQVAG